MKQFFAGCVVVLVAAVGVQLASSATSTSTKSIPARVKALENSVRTLKTTVAALKTKADCLGAQGVSQYGTPASSIGYLYTPDGVNVAVTTAFDATASGQTPTFLAATVNPSCVTSRAFHVVHAATPHATGAYRAP
jgi:hypothetical protein